MPSYLETVLADSPLSYWRLGDTATVATDQMGAATGAYVASPTQNVPGIIGATGNGAVTLNGSTQYVTVADAASLHLVDGPMLLEAWVKRGGLGTNQGVISRGANGYYLRFNAADQLQFLKSQVAVCETSDDALTDTTSWHHIAVRRNGPSVTSFFLDGVLLPSSGGAGQTLTEGGTVATIGADVGGTELFSGSLDEVAIYNTGALSAAAIWDRVIAHYQSGLTAPGNPATPASRGGH